MCQTIKNLISLYQCKQSFVYLMDKQKQGFRVNYKKSNLQKNLIIQSNSKQRIWVLFWEHINNRYFGDIYGQQFNKYKIIKKQAVEQQLNNQNEIQTQLDDLIRLEQNLRDVLTQQYRLKNGQNDLVDSILLQIDKDLQSHIIINQDFDKNIKTISISQIIKQTLYYTLRNQFRLLTQLQTDLQPLFLNIQNQIHSPSINNHSYFILKYFSKQIQNLQKSIFIQSIQHILQISPTLYQIQLDDAFPLSSIKTDRATLKSLLSNFQALICKKQNKLFQKIQKMCHHCRKIQDHRTMTECCTKVKIHQNNIYNNPFEYNKKGEQTTNSVDNYSIGFVNYKKIDNFLICDRYFCNSCLAKYVDLNKIQRQTGYFKCVYCLKQCRCERCNMMDKLIKFKSIYMKNNGNLQNLNKKSIIFKILTQNKSKSKQNSKQRKGVNVCMHKNGLISCNISIQLEVKDLNMTQYERCLKKKVKLR